MTKEGTCKCGLECPLDVEKAFDFDDNVSIIHNLRLAHVKGQMYSKFFYLIWADLTCKSDLQAIDLVEMSERKSS